MLNITKEQAAYAAGILDGEGSVIIDRDRSMSVRIAVGMNRPEVIDWLYGLFGGRRSSYASDKTKMFTWSVYGEDIVLFCRAVRPYVLIKRRQIDIALAFAKTIIGRGKKMDDRTFLIRTRLSELLQEAYKYQPEEVTDQPPPENSIEGEEVIQ